MAAEADSEGAVEDAAGELAGAESALDENPETAAKPERKPDQVPVYLDAIEAAEAIGGSYAFELMDLYQGLGQSLLENGNFEEALDAFHQGVMVARVNFGPNSLEQTNYLFNIAEVESRMGNPVAAAEVMQSIYLVNAKSYGEDNPAMLPALKRMLAWYINQQPLTSNSIGYSDYENRSYLAGRIAELTEVENGLGHPDTAKTYRALGQIHFRTIRYIIDSGEALDPQLVMAAEWSMTQAMRDASLSGHYRSGADAFERAVAAWQENPAGSDLELAESMAQLGDWYLAFEKYQSAQRAYEEAYAVLANSEEYSSLADAYLGQPTPLRFLNEDEEFIRNLDEPEPEKSLEVLMTVTRTGDLQNIIMLNPPDPGLEAQFEKVRKHLRTTRFRPGLVNGKVDKVDRFIWKVPLEEPESTS